MRRATVLRRHVLTALTAMLALCVAVGFYVASTPKASGAVVYKARAHGELDCNGLSPIQQSIRRSMLCTDIRGFRNVRNSNNWNGRFFDNGQYIGHDEPDVTYYSKTPGSGDNVSWTIQLGKDPTQAPTTTNPGHDVVHTVELTPAPWVSMAMCDPNSYPQMPCNPNSDSNAPSGQFPGGGAAFMEMQLYPPGQGPFYDNASCSATQYCAALTIDSLACTYQFAQCNTNCEEPVNFAFIQRNGVPTGPPSPQLSDLQSYQPNAHTLMLNPGDQLSIHMWDALVPNGGGARAFEVTIKDITTGQSGYMQASAANGFANTSLVTCNGSPFNFQPLYNTAAQGNIVPWAALATDISTEFETGHFEPCNSLSGPGSVQVGPYSDTFYSECHGPYENAAPGGDGGNSPEVSDAFCFPRGDTHHGLSGPDIVTGCEDNVLQNGDLDFDGTPYWRDWPTNTSPTRFPSTFLESTPSTNGKAYSQFQMQTDLALSESTCTPNTPSGCAVPPPNAPGNFYPYWTEVATSSACTWEFGNNADTSVKGANTFGKDAQYGTNQAATLGYPEFMGPVYNNTCPASSTLKP